MEITITNASIEAVYSVPLELLLIAAVFLGLRFFFAVGKAVTTDAKHDAERHKGKVHYHDDGTICRA